MNNCCGGMGAMMWIWTLVGAALLVALIVWIIRKSKK
jgi:LPXTG-motif cell wall-anchored protein